MVLLFGIWIVNCGGKGLVDWAHAGFTIDTLKMAITKTAQRTNFAALSILPPTATLSLLAISSNLGTAKQRSVPDWNTT